MPEGPNKLEIWGIKLLLARFKSKSPGNYAKAVKIAVWVGSLAGGYVAAYNMGFPHTTFDHALGIADNVCVVITGMAVTLGFTAKSTTTDPKLLNPDVKSAVIQEAVDKGTHVEVDSITNRGNVTN